MKIHLPTMMAFLVGTGMVSGGFTAVYGQEVDEEKAEEGGYFIEEIVVTAEKREENINDVPLTITAFDSKAIEELGIVDEGDLEALTPGLQFGQHEEQTGQGTVIRGIGTFVAGANHMDMGVATYVNGAYSRTATGVAPNLFDVERVEVARGPQGTLNGKNSIAGSISYVTRKPTPEWDVRFLGEFTDQTTQRYNVAVGGPLFGPFSFRLTGGSYTGEGAQENIGHAGDYDEPDEISYSPQLRFQTDRVDINVRYAFSHDTGVPRTSLSLFDPPRDSPFLCTGPMSPDQLAGIREAGSGTINGVPYECEGSYEEPENFWYLYTEEAPAVSKCGRGTLANQCDELRNMVNTNRPGVSDVKRKAWGVNIDIGITDGLTLQYVYGENELDQFTARDLDLTNQTGPSTPNGAWFDRRNRSPFLMDDQSHEIQLVSNYDGKFNFIVGYYEHEGYNLWAVSRDDFAWDGADLGDTLATCNAVFEGSWADWGGDETYCTEGTDHTTVNYFGTDARMEAEATFAHVTYEHNEKWSFSGGLRHTKDTKQREVQFIYWQKNYQGSLADQPFLFTYATSAKPGTVVGVDPKPSWSKVIWNVGAEYKPTDATMVYGRISTGYRAGGFNDSSVFNPPIRAESLINYEAGVKGLFLDQRLNMRAAAFFQDYDDRQQVATQDPGLPVCSGAPGDESGCLQPTASHPLQEYTTNIPDSQIWGFEIEGNYYLTPQLKVGGFYTYLGSDLGTFSATTQGDPNPEFGLWEHIDTETGQMVTSVYNRPRDWTGSRLPQQPEHKWAITVAYENTFESVPGSFVWSGWYNYTGERFPLVRNIDSQKLRAYNRLDLRATWTSPSEKLTLTAFVQNVMDEIGLVAYLPQSAIANPLYPPMGTLSDPRRIGLVVSWQM
ncbi:MAG: TonB-dependent receptor [Gammaproteobacteria bacterium]|nr:TonB-dependent receptor [Gammaproteobacteria bacterium]